MERRVSGILVHLESNDRFSIACNRPCGAISMIIAFSGMCLHPSSNKTELIKLFVKYSAEQYFAFGLSQSLSGTDVLIHFFDRSLGFVMT